MSQIGKPITNTGPLGYVQNIKGNDGLAVVPTAGTINLLTANSTVQFLRTGVSTETLDFAMLTPYNLAIGTTLPAITTGLNNTIYGTESSGAALSSGINNTIMGHNCGPALGSGSQNCLFGNRLLINATTATNCVAVGDRAMQLMATGSNCVAIGGAALIASVSDTYNVAVGTNALRGLVGGSYCTSVGALSGQGDAAVASSYSTYLGYAAGAAYTTTESSNIIIGANNQGTLLDNNTLRIGVSTGAVNGGLTAAYICGIDGVDVGSVAKVVTMASNKLGTTTINAGAGITITPTANTITISSTGADLLAITSVQTTPYVVLSTDEYLSVDSFFIAITIRFPDAPSSGRVYIVKDFIGSAATNNITLTSVSGIIGFDGATSYVMNTNFASVQLIYNGNTGYYEIF